MADIVRIAWAKCAVKVEGEWKVKRKVRLGEGYQCDPVNIVAIKHACCLSEGGLVRQHDTIPVRSTPVRALLRSRLLDQIGTASGHRLFVEHSQRDSFRHERVHRILGIVEGRR